MKNFLYLATLVLSFTLYSCGSSDSESYDKSLAPVNSTKTVTPVTLADTLLSETTGSNAGVSSQNATVTAGTNVPKNIQPVINPGVAGKGGLNPAHGEPGHRCDISVGAPLSSPVQASAPVTSSPQISTSPVNQSVAKPAITGAGTGKLNPPHGQPGHDCAVQVGAPLKN